MKMIIAVNCTGTIPEQWRCLENSENNNILNSSNGDVSLNKIVTNIRDTPLSYE
jgi:hypothetical protein